jgi:hypothetical protein
VAGPQGHARAGDLANGPSAPCPVFHLRAGRPSEAHEGLERTFPLLRQGRLAGRPQPFGVAAPIRGEVSMTGEH